jgi:acetyl-CoA C-acetyltransferase
MDAYIYDTVRTARGKMGGKGALKGKTPIELVTVLTDGLTSRYEDVDVSDIVLGCVTQAGEQGGHIARIAALAAGLPDKVSAMTLNNFCCSGLDACYFAASKTSMTHQMTLAGGVESMSRVIPFSDRGAYYTDPKIMQKAQFVPLWYAADFIATLHGISREEADTYALNSQQRAEKALANKSTSSIIDVITDDGIFNTEQNPRSGVTFEKLSNFEPLVFTHGPKGLDAAFQEQYPNYSDVSHIHHVGNAPALADAGSLCLIGSREAGEKHSMKPRARIKAYATSSGDPLLSLTGGIEAAKAALKIANLNVDDIDLVEFNEAYAALPILFQRELGFDPDIINVNGGAIALGHPMGATGGILLGTILDELELRGVSVGMVAISGASGVGSAMIIERI